MEHIYYLYLKVCLLYLLTLRSTAADVLESGGLGRRKGGG